MISVDVVGVDVVSRFATSTSVKRFEFDATVVVSHDVQISVFYLQQPEMKERKTVGSCEGFFFSGSFRQEVYGFYDFYLSFPWHSRKSFPEMKFNRELRMAVS